MLNIFTKRNLIPDEEYVLDNDSYFVYTGYPMNNSPFHSFLIL